MLNAWMLESLIMKTRFNKVLQMKALVTFNLKWIRVWLYMTKQISWCWRINQAMTKIHKISQISHYLRENRQSFHAWIFFVFFNYYAKTTIAICKIFYEFRSRKSQSMARTLISLHIQLQYMAYINEIAFMLRVVFLDIR